MGRLTEREPYWLGEEFWTYEMEPTDEEIEAVYEKLRHYENLEEQGLLLRLPCKVGDTVYRICPKCNNDHDGSCKNCAWHGSAGMKGCTVYGLWRDGQFPPHKCTIVPYKVTWNYIPNLLENMGKTVFLTEEDAKKELKNRKCEEMQWLTWKNVKEWGEIQCPMLGDKCVMTYYREDEPCYYSYTAPFVQDGEIYYYRFDHDEGCWDESTYCIGEYREGDWG